ncbi:hypothetical protein Tco_1384302 [Tanacetum coccineum]
MFGARPEYSLENFSGGGGRNPAVAAGKSERVNQILHAQNSNRLENGKPSLLKISTEVAEDPIIHISVDISRTLTSIGFRAFTALKQIPILNLHSAEIWNTRTHMQKTGKSHHDSSKKLQGIKILLLLKQEAADIMKDLKESKKMSRDSLTRSKPGFPMMEEKLNSDEKQMWTVNILTEMIMPRDDNEETKPDPEEYINPCLNLMAPDHSSSGPVLHEMTSDQIHSDLTPNQQETSVDNISSDLTLLSLPHAILIMKICIHFNQQSHEYQWTKDHPLEQVIDNPTNPVQTRQQLATDPEMCMSQLHSEYRRTKEHSSMTLSNKAILVAKGYAQEEGTDFEESSASRRGLFSQPEGRDPRTSIKIYLLSKALYRIEEAPRAWVPDESIVVSGASSEGTGSKPGVPDEEKLILEWEADVDSEHS